MQEKISPFFKMKPMLVKISTNVGFICKNEKSQFTSFIVMRNLFAREDFKIYCSSGCGQEQSLCAFFASSSLQSKAFTQPGLRYLPLCLFFTKQGRILDVIHGQGRILFFLCIFLLQYLPLCL